MEKYIISILVENHPNVLTRISSLFGRRGFNIDSLTVAPTVNQDYSRITIIVIGDDYTLQQVLKQVDKLEECINVSHIREEEAVCREMMLIKINGDEATRESICELCAIYNVKVVENTETSIVVRVDGTPAQIDNFLTVIDSFEIAESSRTGVTAVHSDKKKA